MNKTLLALLVTGFLLGGVQTAFAGDSFGNGESETDPYCETTRNGAGKDYDGIGWSTGPGEEDGTGYIGPNEEVAGGVATVNVCEGEHWDGQDTVAGDENNQGDCTGAGEDNVAVFECDDPNTHEDLQVITPVGVRVSKATDGTDAAAYVSVRIGGVGHSVIFVSECRAGGSELGHYDDQDCDGSVGEAAAGIYVMDNTPFQLNTLAAIVSALRLTKGEVGEGDCTQEEYEHSAYESNNGRKPTCARDNTAISTEILL